MTTMEKFKRISLWVAGGFVSSLVLSVVYYVIFSLVVSTDVERQLALENRLLREELPDIENVARMLNTEIDYLQIKDENIYRQVFKADPPVVSGMIEGDILTEDVVRDADIVGLTFSKGGDAMDRASVVENNWRIVFAAIESSSFPVPPMISPIKGLTYTNIGASTGKKMSPFYKVQINHEGLDIIAPSQTPVYATLGGYVTKVQHSDGGRGNMVEITHQGGFVTRYAHLASTDVKQGTYVKQGRQVGTVGDSGRAFTTHLHYEVERNGVKLDPVHYVFGSVENADDYLNALIMSASSGQTMD